MATPADQRLMELLDKWLSSLDLHLKYSSLDDDTYWKMQPWVEHQRPSRWIIDLAKQKTQALRKEVVKRMENQDAGFSDALELMTFLANLVGSQHIERFIPLADTQSERWVANAAGKMTPASADETREMPAAVSADSPTLPVPTMDMLRADRTATTSTATREMPRFSAPPARAEKPPVTTEQVTRVERRSEPAEEAEKSGAKSASPKQSAKPGTSKTPSKPAGRGSGRADGPPPVSSEMSEQIIADAARLMQWGRKWYELAELISRMADRPPLPDVRRVLKDQKAAIEKLAGR